MNKKCSGYLIPIPGFIAVIFSVDAWKGERERERERERGGGGGEGGRKRKEGGRRICTFIIY